eukprot:gene15862-18848_t
MSKSSTTSTMDTREIKWALSTLREKKDLSFGSLDEWRTGVLLVAILEIITGKKIGRHYPTPKNRIQMIENINISMNFMRSNNLLFAQCSPQGKSLTKRSPSLRHSLDSSRSTGDLLDLESTSDDSASSSFLQEASASEESPKSTASTFDDLVNNKLLSISELLDSPPIKPKSQPPAMLNKLKSMSSLPVRRPVAQPVPIKETIAQKFESAENLVNELRLMQSPTSPAGEDVDHEMTMAMNQQEAENERIKDQQRLQRELEAEHARIQALEVARLVELEKRQQEEMNRLALVKEQERLEELSRQQEISRQQEVARQQEISRQQEMSRQEEMTRLALEKEKEEEIKRQELKEQWESFQAEQQRLMDEQEEERKEQERLAAEAEMERIKEWEEQELQRVLDEQLHHQRVLEEQRKDPRLTKKPLPPAPKPLPQIRPDTTVESEPQWKRRLTNRPMSGSGFNIGRARNQSILPDMTSVQTPLSPTADDSPSKSWFTAKVDREENVKRKPHLVKQSTLLDMERYTAPEYLRIIVRCQCAIRCWMAVRELKRRKKHNTHRNRCFKEILSTEENYVMGVEMIVKVFYQQIVWNSKVSPTPYLTSDMINTIFSTINEIYSFNTELLSRLRERAKDWSSHQKIGDIFLMMAPYLKLYKTYCLNYDAAIECLQVAKKNEKFKMFIRACLEHPENPHKQSLESLLITIVQRIPRYILLLNDLAQHTWPSHVDHSDLRAALKIVQTVAGEVNTSIKNAESQDKVLEIQRSLIGADDLELVSPSRLFIKQGIIYLCRLDSRFSKDFDEMAFFSFNDSVLVAEKRSIDKYQFKYFFELSSTRVKDVEDSQVLKNAIQILSGETTAMFAFNTEQQKKAMIEFIQRGKSVKSRTTISMASMPDMPSLTSSASFSVDQTVGEFTVQMKRTESKKIPGKKPFTLYIIDIVNETTGDVYTISKRYSDFDNLHKKLKKKFPEADLKDLPKKHLINSLGSNTVESRRVMLEVFLQDLFQKETIKNSSYLLAFIKPPPLTKALSDNMLDDISSFIQKKEAEALQQNKKLSVNVTSSGGSSSKMNDFIDYISDDEDSK